MNEKFVITIARGYGSGGRTIGKMLSKNLSIPFYDRDLVYMASEESGINVKLFGQNDESVKKKYFFSGKRQIYGRFDSAGEQCFCFT